MGICSIIMTNTIYLHWGLLSYRGQWIINLCAGIALLGVSIYEFFWAESPVTFSLAFIFSMTLFQRAYKYYQVGDEAAVRIQTTGEGLLIKQSPKPSDKVNIFQWQHIEEIKIDHHDRQMTVVLSYESPHVNRRYFFWLRSLSQDKLQALEQLLQPYLTSHEIPLHTTGTANQSDSSKSA